MLIGLTVYLFFEKQIDLFLDIVNADIFKFNVDWYFNYCYMILVKLNFDFSIKLIEGGKND